MYKYNLYVILNLSLIIHSLKLSVSNCTTVYLITQSFTFSCRLPDLPDKDTSPKISQSKQKKTQTLDKGTLNQSYLINC